MTPHPVDGAPVADSERAERALAALAEAFAALPRVEAVALGGSRATGAADENSDIDLYVYSSADVPVGFRETLAAARSARREIDNRFWEPGDEWDDTLAGVHVDVMYRSPAWAENEISRVLDACEAKLGYSTCFWHNILTARILFDRDGWFARLQARSRRPYPDELARAVVAKNHPVLRTVFGSFAGQILKAVDRCDLVSLNHRVAAFLGSYFDVLFALNRAPHPGEKRLIAAAAMLPRVPANMAADVENLLEAAGGSGDGLRIAVALGALCEGLDGLLRDGVRA